MSRSQRRVPVKVALLFPRFFKKPIEFYMSARGPYRFRTGMVWARIGSASGPYRFGIGPYWILLDSKNTYLDSF